MHATASIDVDAATRALEDDPTGHADALASPLVDYLSAPDDARTAALRAILCAHDNGPTGDLVRPVLSALVDALATVDEIVSKARGDDPAANVAARDLANLDRHTLRAHRAALALRDTCEA